jgi:predicted hydrolase (HD superfamily)
MMTKQETLNFIREKGQSENIIKHLISVGAAMRALAEYFHENAEDWEIAGFIHDADYNLVPIKRHTYQTEEWFKEQVNPEVIQAVHAHFPDGTGVQPESKMDWALYSVDNLAGLIVASALIRPDKKLAGLTTESVLKRFNEKSFARGANREEIIECKNLHLSLEEFISIVLPGVQKQASELGL